ncbi:hypothetical protein MXB_657, partial [Myxobolus squamalis]
MLKSLVFLLFTDIVAVNSLTKKSFEAGSQVSIVAKISSDCEIQVGSVLCSIEFPCHFTDRFTSKLVVFKTPQPLLVGTKFTLHYLQNNVPAKLAKILHTNTKNSDPKIVPRLIVSDSHAEVVICTEFPIPVDLYDSIKTMGRFVLRLKD